MARNVVHKIAFIFKAEDQFTSVADRVRKALENVSGGLTGSLRGALGDVQNRMVNMHRLFSDHAAQLDQLSQAARNSSRGVNQFAREQRKANGVAQKGTGSLVELAGAYNALVVAKHAARAVMTVLKPALDMQEAMLNLSAATGVAGADLDKLRRSAVGAALATSFSPEEAMEGARVLQLAIGNVDATGRAMIPTLSAAQTFLGRDIPKAATIASKLIGGFGVKVEDLNETMSMYFAGARAAGVDVKKLDTGLGTLAAAATSVGSNFMDMYPAYLMAAKGGLAANASATSLKTGLGRLANPKVAEQLRTSLKITSSLSGKFLTVENIFKQLSEAQMRYARNSKYFATQIQKAFGERAKQSILVILDRMRVGIKDNAGNVWRGAEAWDHLHNSMRDGTTVLDEASQTVMGGANRQIGIFFDSLKDLAASVFEYVAPAIGLLVAAFNTVVQALSWVVNLPVIGHLLKGLALVFTLVAGKMLLFKLGGLAAAAVSQILGAAQAFSAKMAAQFADAQMAMGISAKSSTQSIKMSEMGLVAWTRAAVAAKYQALRLSLSWKNLSATAARGYEKMTTGLIGPGGLLTALLVMAYIVYDVFSAIRDVGKDTDARLKEAKDAGNTIWTRLNTSLASRLGEFSFTVTDLQRAVSGLEQIEKEKMPMSPQAAIEKMDSFGQALSKLSTDQFSVLGRERMGAAMDMVKNMQGMLMRGEAPTAKELSAARNSLAVLVMLFKARFPTQHKAIKAMENLHKAWVEGGKNLAMTQTLMWMGQNMGQLQPGLHENYQRLVAIEAAKKGTFKRDVIDRFRAGLTKSTPAFDSIFGSSNSKHMNKIISSLDPKGLYNYALTMRAALRGESQNIAKFGKYIPTQNLGVPESATAALYDPGKWLDLASSMTKAESEVLEDMIQNYIKSFERMDAISEERYKAGKIASEATAHTYGMSAAEFGAPVLLPTEAPLAATLAVTGPEGLTQEEMLQQLVRNTAKMAGMKQKDLQKVFVDGINPSLKSDETGNIFGGGHGLPQSVPQE